MQKDRSGNARGRMVWMIVMHEGGAKHVCGVTGKEMRADFRAGALQEASS